MFAARLVAENGLIKLVRESLNVVAAAQALLPGGVKDLPDPEKEIFSLPGLLELKSALRNARGAIQARHPDGTYHK